jgi:hypothetical protein
MRAGVAVADEDAEQHPRDIGVHDGGPLPEREAHDRPGSVGTDALEGQERRLVGRQPAVVARDGFAGNHLQGARLILLGGETLNGPRYIWWNFVASSREKIDAAKQAWADGDWEHGRFRLPPDDRDEFIPLPD